MLDKSVMHKYQVALCEAIKQRHKIAIWADMGTGKTVSTLTAIQELLDEGDIKHVLIIAPLTVAKFTWPGEYEKWGHITFSLSVVTGSKPKRIKQLNRNNQVDVINKENVAWLVEESRTWSYDMVIIDESSMLKSHAAKIFKALKSIREQTLRIVELTGTPMSTSYMDLWPQIYMLDRGKAIGKNITAFRGRYFYQPRPYVYKLHNFAAAEIQQKIKPLVYRLDAADVGSQIPVNYKNDLVELPSGTKKQYNYLRKEFLAKINDDIILIDDAKTLSLKLRQFANGFLYDTDKLTGIRKALFVHDEKLKRLKELVSDLQGEPVIVAYQFEYERDQILKAFSGAETIHTEGALYNWNAGLTPMLVCHPLNTAHGLNLQFGGHNLIWYSLPWSLEHYMQLNARLARPGQKKAVSVAHILCADTIDAKGMLPKLQLRLTDSKEILDYMKNNI